MKLIFLGPPGVGKGTQAARIADAYNLDHISTGEALRDAVKRGTSVGKQAKSYMDQGALVPDGVIMGIIRERMTDSVLLDGFPRTVAQAEMLDQMLCETSAKLDAVISIEAAEQVLIERLSGRRTCKQCGQTFHIEFMPPKQAGICDVCGGELFQRNDDKPESISNRLKVYVEQTAPLIEYYKQSGKLKTVNGEQDVDQVYESVVKVLDTLH